MGCVFQTGNVHACGQLFAQIPFQLQDTGSHGPCLPALTPLILVGFMHAFILFAKPPI